MNFENLKYDIQKNKSKLMLAGAVLILLIVGIIAFKVFGVRFDYNSKNKDSVSNKYVLADNILGANKDGKINLYNIKTGEVVSSLKLEGENYLFSHNDDMKSLNAYNKETKELYSVTSKSSKIKASKIGKIDLGEENVLNFKYKNNYFVGILGNGSRLACVDVKKSKKAFVDMKLNTYINNFEIVNKNVVFTSGDYIGTAKLEDGKGTKIDMGAKNASIHVTKNKLFVHNRFGADRNKSILLDINPETLYINNVCQFRDSNVNMFKTSSKSEILYYTEEFLTSAEGSRKQVFKTIGEEMKNPASLLKHISKDSINNLNSYGYLGYIYCNSSEGLGIFNLKSLDKEYTLNVNDDFYMPIY